MLVELAFCEIVMWFGSTMLKIVLPCGMPAPLIGKPTNIPAALATATVELPLVVLVICEIGAAALKAVEVVELVPVAFADSVMVVPLIPVMYVLAGMLVFVIVCPTFKASVEGSVIVLLPLVVATPVETVCVAAGPKRRVGVEVLLAVGFAESVTVVPETLATVVLAARAAVPPVPAASVTGMPG